MKIFIKLIAEENFLADKIIFYDNEEALANDLTAEELPHLVLTLADEAQLFAAIKKHGLLYGKHVISFRQEYLNHCEKLFHNLGK